MGTSITIDQLYLHMDLLSITGIIASLAIMLFVIVMLYLVVLGYHQDHPETNA